MAVETFEARMERACRDLEIPGAVLVGGDKEGVFFAPMFSSFFTDTSREISL